MIIICKVHGEFKQAPGIHISGSGCWECSKDRQRLTTEEFVKRAKKVHDDKYDYSVTNYINCTISISIRCRTHGIFKQLPDSHLRKGECPKCRPTEYSRKAIDWLEYMAKKENIYIQHTDSGGEFKIPGTKYSPDGYSKENNTVWEFCGAWWYGAPHIYNPDDINPIKENTFGELYSKTVKRSEEIKKLGYNLVTIWKNVWDKMIKEMKKN